MDVVDYPVSPGVAIRAWGQGGVVPLRPGPMRSPEVDTGFEDGRPLSRVGARREGPEGAGARETERGNYKVSGGRSARGRGLPSSRGIGKACDLRRAQRSQGRRHMRRRPHPEVPSPLLAHRSVPRTQSSADRGGCGRLRGVPFPHRRQRVPSWRCVHSGGSPKGSWMQPRPKSVPAPASMAAGSIRAGRHPSAELWHRPAPPRVDPGRRGARASDFGWFWFPTPLLASIQTPNGVAPCYAPS